MVLALALMAAACSGGGTDTASDSGGGATDPSTADGGGDADGDDETDLPDPCSLWTTADLQAATGVGFGEGVFNDSLSAPQRQLCDWITPEGAPLATAQVLVSGDPDVFEGSRTDATTDMDVPGADAAYSINDDDIIGMDVGGLFVQVAYLPAGTADTLAEVAAANV